jgi:dihydroorotase
MYDLLIKGGRVIDLAQKVDGFFDIAISEQKVARVAEDISANEGKQVLDAKGKIVTPGLIDMHCHIYDSVHSISIEPDVAGVKQGVTTVVDGGSTGQATFRAFPKYIIPPSKSTVFCFLHLCSLGQLLTPELRDWKGVDLDAIKAVVNSNREIIKGIKLRLVGNIVASDGPKVIKITRELARSLGLPMMVHIGDPGELVPPELTQELLSVMDAGDILTHVFTSKQGGILRPDGTVLPELREAMDRGIVMEVAHGRNNFSFAVARKCMDQGISPTVLSTDLNTLCLNGPVFGMAALMSKFMALGLSLDEVVKMSTINPARALGIDNRAGSLQCGMDADVSILELNSGKWEMEDSVGQTMITTSLLTPRVTIKSGLVIPAEPVAWPQPVM